MECEGGLFVAAEYSSSTSLGWDGNSKSLGSAVSRRVFTNESDDEFDFFSFKLLQKSLKTICLHFL